MSQTLPAARKLIIGRLSAVAAVVGIGWALAIYPIAFEYAWRESRAAGRLGFFSAGMADLASGWFTAFLIVSSAAASLSLAQIRDQRPWRVVAWLVLLGCTGLVGGHALFDGPAFVARNLWSAVTHPTSFHWPLDYFKVAIKDWGAWP